MPLTRKQRLKKTLRSVNKRHGIPNIELIHTYSGLLATGKSDFEAVENIRNDDWFQRCMGIRQMPSAVYGKGLMWMPPPSGP